MNVILSGIQSDTKRGEITLPASVNLTGLEGSLVKVVNNNGVPNFALPTATDDFAVYVLLSGDVAGNNVAAESPGLNDNCRVFLTGNCNPGDELSLSSATYGTLQKTPTTTGTWRTLFIAEEAGVNGQSVKCRRVGERTHTY